VNILSPPEIPEVKIIDRKIDKIKFLIKKLYQNFSGYSISSKIRA